MSVCQERFFANGTTTCERYTDIIDCGKVANSLNMTLFCIHDGKDYGDNGNLAELPREMIKPYLCNSAVCPIVSTKIVPPSIYPTNSGHVTKAGMFVVAMLYASIAIY
ncbi:hypothetical protein EC991_002518 [Linnemannia zychae]|nr:hypothetical protein EC991_002518 [Linnemannia zychae]